MGEQASAGANGRAPRLRASAGGTADWEQANVLWVIVAILDRVLV